MSDIIERLEGTKHGLYWDVARDAIAEITRLRTLLSEAEKREERVALESYTDEEFIAEAQRRVNQGNLSPDRYMSKLQSNDRAKLETLRSAVIEAKVASIHAGESHPALIYLALLCDKLDSITGHEPIQAVAVNTTRYGRELGQ